MSQKLIRTLLHLAQADGNVSGSELALIYKIAIEKSLPMFEVEQLIQNPPRENQELEELPEEERFEYLYTLILMMKMDGKLDDREAELCDHYAVSLGYSKEVIPQLMTMIESDQQLSSNKEALRKEVQKFKN
ncbi:MAG: hypothetical protein DHS20C17_15260 [Cyclobacteriaceae bacterium]|nr:MAG: hypothetical protein DHS20C17_15260 [Cyclobacteriaceae bacterium]